MIRVKNLILFFFQATVSAEYSLKQGKLHLSIDSNLTVKSSLETSLSPGVNLLGSAEVSTIADVYRFGYGLSMG